MRCAQFRAPTGRGGGGSGLGVLGISQLPVLREQDGESDLVECAVYAPGCVTPGETILLNVFAYLAPDALQVDKLATEFDPRARRRAYTCLEIVVKRMERLTFYVTADGCTVDNPIRHVIWSGNAVPTQFAVTIGRNLPREAVIGKVTICVRGVPVGHLVFSLAVRDSNSHERPVSSSGRVYRQVFVSYASRDRDEVLKRVQMLNALRMDYLQDMLKLHPGDRWEQQLHRYIDSADLFLLFWSSAAQKSEWVRKEVSYALKRKGSDDSPPEILPVVIERPFPAPPPELAHLHFGDHLLYMQPAP
jgi:hypothetical protein